LLLDFHLARSPLPGPPGEGPPPAWLGGTPGHMAPEHEAALAAVRAGRPVPAAVDGRADLYALGLLLGELLGGGAQAELRRRNPCVSRGLADLLGRCRAARPEDRYATAGELAAD